MAREARSSDWQRKVGGVDWCDVWAWCDDVREHYGLWCHFCVNPPLPSQEGKVLATVTLIAQRYILGGRVTQDQMYRTVSRSRGASVTEVALQMAAFYSAQLDRAAYEAERNAVEQGLLL